MPSDFLETLAEDIIAKLSFSHIVEIMTLEDSFERFFYETECIKCCWNVQELRRQIATNLFFRSGISQNPKNLLETTKTNNISSLSIKEPFSFEFLGLRAEQFTETDLENALINHLQEFILGRNNNSDYLFCTSKKPFNQMSKCSIQSIVKDVGKRANLPDITVHCFRRWLASDLNRKGID